MLQKCKVLYVTAMCYIHAFTVFSLKKKKKKKVVLDPRIGRETSAFPFLPPLPTTDPIWLFCVQGFEKGGVRPTEHTDLHDGTV